MVSRLLYLSILLSCFSVGASEPFKQTNFRSIQNSLTVATFKNSSDLFSVRELHDMGSSGIQQIDYVVNCANQTLALVGFAVLRTSRRLTSISPESNARTPSFYAPQIEHDQRIVRNVCGAAINQKADSSSKRNAL